MTATMQIAVDCANPHTLNRFWAAALGYEVEDHSGQVAQMIEEGFVTESDSLTFEGKLAWRTAAACRDPEGVRPRLLFQQVPEPKTAKNRVHLDLHVSDEVREAEVARIVGLGATRLWDGQQGPHTWVTLADPEGNEFCVG